VPKYVTETVCRKAFEESDDVYNRSGVVFDHSGPLYAGRAGTRGRGGKIAGENPAAAPLMKELDLAEVYRLLEPGPVVLLTTSRNGRANVMTMSWHMMVEFTPPLVACVVSSNDYSFAALRATKECVIAIPAVELAPTVVKVGNCSGRDTNKFATFELTPLAAERVAPPLIAECFANLECRVADTRLVNKYNLFVLEVIKAWRDSKQRQPKTIHHQGYGTFIVDGEAIHLKSKMP
jgi:flavin reductase (DIM6/NTAB) family NADH-FMN oxidoreductase RutF